MRILQVLPPRATQYEQKSQRIDFELLRSGHDVFLGGRVNADVTLIYGRPPVSDLPEAVEERWLMDPRLQPGPAKAGAPFTIASYRRKSIRSLVDQTMARLHRTRDDIEWLLLDEPPSDFSGFDAWVDPAVEEDDRDGFVAEAQVSGNVVVATRTEFNTKRLEKGRTGLLVPPHDANELTHAILAALFKPEVAQQKIEAAQQTISKFHPRQRLRALMPLLKA